MARLLADTYRLVLMDRRGHGGSDGTRGVVNGEDALRQESEGLVAVIAATAPPGSGVTPEPVAALIRTFLDVRQP